MTRYAQNTLCHSRKLVSGICDNLSIYSHQSLLVFAGRQQHPHKSRLKHNSVSILVRHHYAYAVLTMAAPSPSNPSTASRLLCIPTEIRLAILETLLISSQDPVFRMTHSLNGHTIPCDPDSCHLVSTMDKLEYIKLSTQLLRVCRQLYQVSLIITTDRPVHFDHEGGHLTMLSTVPQSQRLSRSMLIRYDRKG